jgi:aspartate racemase
MKTKTIGIIGGAGPLAGVALLDRIFQLAQIKYSCWKDSDFPKLILISFPFSEMLTPPINEEIIKIELRNCFNFLRENNASAIGIACNTLHGFIDERDDKTDLVHLMKVVAASIPKSEIPLVLCTSTSVKFAVHQKFFPCTYPDFQTQNRLDATIDLVLKGDIENGVLNLVEILNVEKANTIILGCTELSQIAGKLNKFKKNIIDPFEIIANTLLKISFGG